MNEDMSTGLMLRYILPFAWRGWTGQTCQDGEFVYSLVLLGFTDHNGLEMSATHTMQGRIKLWLVNFDVHRAVHRNIFL